jgi:hypothetical protein
MFVYLQTTCPHRRTISPNRDDFKLGLAAQTAPRMNAPISARKSALADRQGVELARAPGRLGRVFG